MTKRKTKAEIKRAAAAKALVAHDRCSVCKGALDAGAERCPEGARLWREWRAS